MSLSPAFSPAIAATIEQAGIVAVLVVDHAKDAVPLARALLAERVELKPHSVASWLHYGDALDQLGDRTAVAARERAASEARRVSAREG